MAGLATHESAEPGSLVVRVGLEERAYLLEDAPETYYVTDSYRELSGRSGPAGPRRPRRAARPAVRVVAADRCQSEKIAPERPGVVATCKAFRGPPF